MSDVTDLKAEVLLLRRENKELRELVRHMYVCTCHIDIDVGYRCDWCEYDNTEGKCDFERRLRELGVTA